MNEKIFGKVASAHYGNDVTAIDPAIIALIVQLIQGLLANCNPQRAKLAMVFPVLSGARRRIRNHVEAQKVAFGEDFDVSKVCATVEKLGASATTEDMEEIKAMAI